MKSKDDIFKLFKEFVSLMETQSGKKLKALRLDNGGEYISKEFIDFYASKQIKREFTTPYTPTQNGVVEWMNKTIQEQIMSMLSQTNLTQGFWAKALYIAVYSINCSPHASLNFKVQEELQPRHKVSYDRI